MREEGAQYKEPTPAQEPAREPARDAVDAAIAADDGSEIELSAAHEQRSATASTAMHGERLDKALVQMAPEFSRSHLQQLIARGHVSVDGVVAGAASRRLRAGQQLALELVPTDESQAFRPQPMVLSVLFEDEHLLVIDKPAGLVVHPAPGNWSGTLLNGLLARNPGAASLPRAGIVHRLDKDTSGVMLVGKTLPAVTALSRDIATRVVHRRYLALVHGVPPEAAFTVDAPIARDPVMRVRMAVVPGGRPSRTDVRLLAANGVHSALSCTLHTGRTHQIRVHLASRGHPLVGDVLYGGRLQLGIARQALHATALRLAHPVSRMPLVFDCEPPADFAAAWRQVAGGAPAG